MKKIVEELWTLVLVIRDEAETADMFVRLFQTCVEPGRRPGEAFFAAKFRGRALVGGESFPEQERKLRAAGATYAQVNRTEARSFCGKTWLKVRFAVRATPEELKAALAARGDAWYEAKAAARKAEAAAEAQKMAEIRARLDREEAERAENNRLAAAEADARRAAQEADGLAEAEAQAEALRADGIEVLQVAARKVVIKVLTYAGRNLPQKESRWTFVCGRRGWEEGWYLEQANYPKVKTHLLDAVNAEWTNRKR